MLRRCLFWLPAVVLTLACLFGQVDKANAAAKIIQITPENRVGKLRVTLGQSEIVRITVPYGQIIVGDPETADVAPLTDQLFYVLGRKLGTTNVTLFDLDKQVAAVVDIEVAHDLSGLRTALREGVPGSKIRLRSVNGRVLLDGEVASAPAAEKAMRIAKDFAGEDVTNSMTVAATQQVNLEVRFLEVSRRAGRELGLNWNLSNNGNGALLGSGVVSGQFNSPFATISPFTASLPFGTILANVLGNGVSPDVVITALEQKRLARRLAEPNLTALSGEIASFHAGGEFPVPVEAEDNKVTIEFKEFGVRLTFAPVVLDNGLISLKIMPEVSEIDPSVSIRVSATGILIPGLAVRRASTTVELRDGQSFAIAGLLQSVNEKVADQVPWLGDVPVLGALFRSSAFQKRESDLVIIVTPRLVHPIGTEQQLVSPLDTMRSTNDPEFFLEGKLEIARKTLAKQKYPGVYGHILDLPKGYSGVPNK